MRRATLFTTMMTLLASAAFASDAQTSATAGSNSNQRNGTAAATAQYEGDLGFARTDSQSGSLNRSRGVAVGVDEDGLSLSLSNAFATRYGPAVATSFNLSIGRDGQVSRSGGLTIADGPLEREATAGGRTSTGRQGNTATAQASGRTDRYGRVETQTFAHSTPNSRPATVRYARSPASNRLASNVRVVPGNRIAPSPAANRHVEAGRTVSHERRVVKRVTTVRHVRR